MTRKGSSLSFFVARRYLFAKKSHNLINVISAISAVGVAFGTMALVLVLSVFNGFENMIVSMFNSFTPDLLVEPARSKVFPADSLNLYGLDQMEEVLYYSEIIQDNALLQYDQQQEIVELKGVRADYYRMNDMDTLIIDGEFSLGNAQQPLAVFGQGVAYRVGLRIDDFFEPIELYVPKRTKKVILNSENSFNRRSIFSSSVFAAHPELDDKVVLVPIEFAEELYGLKKQYTHLEIKINPNYSLKRAKAEVEKKLGPNFVVKTKQEQQGLLYKILQSEKWAIFMILSFILLIAIFSHVGSLTLLILEKRKDIGVLSYLGGSLKLIKRIFFTEGMIIILSGLIVGVLLGTSISLVQQYFEIIMISSPDGMMSQAYPVDMRLGDIVLIFIVVFVIGIATSYFPLRKINSDFVTTG